MGTPSEPPPSELSAPDPSRFAPSRLLAVEEISDGLGRSEGTSSLSASERTCFFACDSDRRCTVDADAVPAPPFEGFPPRLGAVGVFSSSAGFGGSATSAAANHPSNAETDVDRSTSAFISAADPTLEPKNRSSRRFCRVASRLSFVASLLRRERNNDAPELHSDIDAAPLSDDAREGRGRRTGSSSDRGVSSSVTVPDGEAGRQFRSPRGFESASLAPLSSLPNRAFGDERSSVARPRSDDKDALRRTVRTDDGGDGDDAPGSSILLALAPAADIHGSVGDTWTFSKPSRVRCADPPPPVSSPPPFTAVAGGSTEGKRANGCGGGSGGGAPNLEPNAAACAEGPADATAGVKPTPTPRSEPTPTPTPTSVACVVRNRTGTDSPPSSPPPRRT